MSLSRDGSTTKRDQARANGRRTAIVLGGSVAAGLTVCVVVALIGFGLMPNQEWINDHEFSKQFWSGLAGNYFSSVISGIITGLVVGIFVWYVEHRYSAIREHELEITQKMRIDRDFMRDRSILLSDILVEIFQPESFGGTRAIDSCNQAARRVALLAGRYPLDLWIEDGRDESGLFNALKELREAHVYFLTLSSIVDERISIAIRTVHQHKEFDLSRDDFAHQYAVGRLIGMDGEEMITRLGLTKASLTWLEDDLIYVEKSLNEKVRQRFVEARTKLNSLMASFMERREILKAGAQMRRDAGPSELK